MSGEERRTEILKMIQSGGKPVSGSRLSEIFNVSRQVIVQDIALLRASNYDIVSTNRGYICNTPKGAQRTFKVFHDNKHLLDELNSIVDLGGKVIDVHVNHKIYGKIYADMSISSRRDAQEMQNQIDSGKSEPLLNVTSGYHYHTVTAENEQILDMIEEELQKKGYLVQ